MWITARRSVGATTTGSECESKSIVRVSIAWQRNVIQRNIAFHSENVSSRRIFYNGPPEGRPEYGRKKTYEHRQRPRPVPTPPTAPPPKPRPWAAPGDIPESKPLPPNRFIYYEFGCQPACFLCFFAFVFMSVYLSSLFILFCIIDQVYSGHGPNTCGNPWYSCHI